MSEKSYLKITMSEKSYLKTTIEALKDARRDNIAEIAYEQAGDQPDIGIISACEGELREIHGLLIVLEDYAMKLAGAAPNNAPPTSGDPPYTTRLYPCGCRAEGQGDVPAYCGEHGAQRLNATAKQDVGDPNVAGQAASPQQPTDAPTAEEARFICDVRAAGGEYLGNGRAAFSSVGETLAFGMRQAGKYGHEIDVFRAL